MDVFGELRSALEAPACAGVWLDVCALLERVEPARFVDEVSPYLDGRLASWPDALRRVPRRWMMQSLEEAPWLGHCRALNIRPQMFRGDPAEALATILRAPWVSGITHLALHPTSGEHDADLSDALFENDRLAGVRHLTMERGSVFTTQLDPEPAGQRIAQSALMRDLQELHLTSVLRGLNPQRISQTFQSWLSDPAMANLEVLDVRDSEYVMARIAIEEISLPHLHTLRWHVPARHMLGARPAPAAGWMPSLRHVSWVAPQHYEDPWPEIVASHDLESLEIWAPDQQTPWFGRVLDAIGADNEVRSLRLELLDEESAVALSEFEGWAKLEDLEIRYANLKGRAARTILQELDAPSLTRLRLHEVEATPHLMRGIERLERLEEIDISQRSKLEEKGARWLAAHPGRWTRLTLDRAMLRTAGAEALLASPALEGVRHLDLTGNKIGREGVRALVSCEHLGSLEALYLGTHQTGNELDAQAIELLAGWPGLSKLKLLSLGCARLPSEALGPLLHASMPAMEVLDLTLNEVELGGLETLCANPSTRSLRALALTKASLTHEAVEALVETTWPKLQVLTMHDNNLRTPAFDLLLPWLNAQPCLEVFDAGSAFLQFIERRRQVPINFEVTTVLSYRGLTDRELAPHHVFTTLG